MARKKNSETTTAAEIKAEKSIKEDTKKSSSAKKAKTDSAVKEADKAKEAAAAKQSVSEDNAKNPGAAKKAKTAQEDLIKVQLGSSEFDITNIKKAVEEDFRNLQELEQQYSDLQERKVKVSEQYRGTYWYYYRYE